MSGLGIPSVADPAKATSPEEATQRLTDLKKAFPKMHLAHSLVITTTDPLDAVACATQLAKDLEMSLQQVSLKHYRRAEPVINLRLQCDDACSVEALANHIRDQQCVSQVMVEHLLTEQPNS